MGWIINIETSTSICSVALSRGGKLVALKETAENRSHARLLSVFIDELLRENKLQAADLQAIAISKGPGSYTGLRIGVSTAKGLAYGLQIPLIAINTLQAMAAGFRQKHPDLAQADHLLCPMIDARRMEVYAAFFDAENNFVRQTAADIIDNQSYSKFLAQTKVLFFGNGAAKCQAVLQHPNAIFVDNFEASAQHLVALSQKAYQAKDFVDVAYFEPFYLKDFVATIPKKIFR